VAKNKKQVSELVGFLGVGLDHQDQHYRITRNDHFLLVGGCEETHEKMQDVSVHFNEALEKRGKQLHEATLAEIVELMRRAMDR
jgi:hypothetical protein